MTATTIILIDRVFYETLLLVQQHAKIDFEQVGKYNSTRVRDSLFREIEMGLAKVMNIFFQYKLLIAYFK